MVQEKHGFLELRIAGRGKREHSTAGDLRCLCREELAGELQSLYESHEWVYDALSNRHGAEVLRGRQPVLTGQIGGCEAVVKRFHHGGWTTNLWKDRFLSPARFRSHIELSAFLAGYGIPTPGVLFVAWRRIFGTFRGEIGFARIDGLDADRWFFRAGVVPADWPEQARRIGELVARLHRIGFHHRDMNLMNFYFGGDGRLFILDLDKARIDGAMSTEQKTATLARLERSIRKQGRGRDGDYVEGVVRELRQGYAESHA